MNEKLPTNEMVIIIRPSFKRICGPDACRAALYNHILYRLARKAKDEPETKVKAGEVFWYASAEDICQDIDEAWCVNKVRKEIKQLVTDGLLGQRHNPAKGWDRKFQYFIGPEQGEKLLEKTREKEVCLLHIGLNAEVTHLLHMVNAFNKNGACICHKEEMDLPDMADASTKNGGAIPKGSTKGSTKGASEEATEGSESTSPQPGSQLDESGSVEPARTHSSQFAFQVQGFAHFYHDYCIHAQDRGINDGITLVVKNLADVPPDAECQICYKPVHGPHGYGEPSLAERANQFSGTTNYPGKVWPDGSVTSELAQQKGQPDATTQETAGPDSREKRVAPTEQPAGSVATALTATVPTGKTAATAQLSTSMTTYPQASAKVEPEKPKKPASGRTQSKKSEKPDPEFTPEGRKVYDAWCSLFKSPPRTAEKTVDCANDLYARLMPWCQDLRVSCKDLLSEIKGWLYTTDPDWYRRKGVTLCDIGSQFERWQSAKTEELERAKKPTKTTQQEQSPLELLRAQQQRYAQLPAKG